MGNWCSWEWEARQFEEGATTLAERTRDDLEARERKLLDARSELRALLEERDASDPEVRAYVLRINQIQGSIQKYREVLHSLDSTRSEIKTSALHHDNAKLVNRAARVFKSLNTTTKSEREEGDSIADGMEEQIELRRTAEDDMKEMSDVMSEYYATGAGWDTEESADAIQDQVNRALGIGKSASKTKQRAGSVSVQADAGTGDRKLGAADKWIAELQKLPSIRARVAPNGGAGGNGHGRGGRGPSEAGVVILNGRKNRQQNGARQEEEEEEEAMPLL